MISKSIKKSQISIFVIVGIVLVIAVVALFAFFNIEKTARNIENPKNYMQGCIEDSLKDIEEKIIQSNGFPEENLKNYMIYKGEKIPYLCSVSEFYIPCMPQYPMLIEDIRKQIKDYIQEKTDKCFAKIKKGYESQGYEFKQTDSEIEIVFNEEILSANIIKSISISKEEETLSYDFFKGNIKSPLYILFDTSREIVNFESYFCEFNNINWVLNHPEVIINRFRASDQTKVYTLKYRDSEKEIKFAVRTCVLPAGL